MEKSDQIKYDEDGNPNPSASPVYFNQSVTNDQGFIHQPVPPTYPGFHHGVQNQPGFTNSGFQQDVHHQPGIIYPGFQQDVHHQPGIIDPGFQQDVHHQPGIINPGFQQDIDKRPGFVPNQPINTLPAIVPPLQDRNDGYCESLHRNRRQTGSIAGGLFLMLVSGLHIGWGIWRTIYVGFWLVGISQGLLIFTIMAWPVGALVGGFIGSALTLLLRKNVIYYITAVIMTIGNMLFIIWDRDSTAIIIGRILTSFAHGIAFVTIITHAGENAANNTRGIILSTINCMLYTAIFISVIISGTVQINVIWTGNISIERLIGIMGLIFAVSSIVCTITLTVETVPFLLKNDKPNDAMTNLKHLRDVTHETPQITREMEELTLMINQDKQDDRNIFTNGNGNTIGMLIIARLMVALTNNYLLNDVLISYCQLIFPILQIRYAPLVIVAPRLLMSVVQIFYADVLGRKIQIIVSSFLAGMAVIAFGIIVNTVDISLLSYYFIPSIFCINFQLFCSIGIDQMQDVYLSEAFSTAKKPWSISFVVAFEHIFHIFMIGMYFVGFGGLAGISALVFITGITIIIFGLMLTLLLPETRRTTLKEARDLHRSAIRIRSPVRLNL